MFERPTSALRYNGNRINYFNFISSLEIDDCNNALQRIAPQIDLQRINALIDNIECISELQKDFYKTMLSERKEKIIDFSLQKLHEKNVNRDKLPEISTKVPKQPIDIKIKTSDKDM